MQRICVIGCCGAGKSTMSLKIGGLLGLPVFHMDQLFWGPGWRERRYQDFIEDHAACVNEDAWVFDGNYTSTLAKRIERADTVIFLDFPTWRCLMGILARWRRFRGETRPDMAPGNPEKVDLEFFLYVLLFRMRQRPKVLDCLEGLPEGTELYIFNNHRQIEGFLHKLTQAYLAKG